MCCRVTDLRYKDVISVKDGSRLGFVSDVEVDTCTAKVVSIVIFGRGKFFGFFGKGEDIVICWEDIVIIGEDTILVKHECPAGCKPKKSLFDGWFK